jgi:hypothetical protein
VRRPAGDTLVLVGSRVARAEDPSLSTSLGTRGPARGFARLAPSWPATSASAAPEPPSLSRKALLTEGGSGVQVAGQDRAREMRDGVMGEERCQVK